MLLFFFLKEEAFLPAKQEAVEVLQQIFADWLISQKLLRETTEERIKHL